MSSLPRRGMKRENDVQLRKEDDDDADYDDRDPRSLESFSTTPQLASAEEMTTRRVIRVSNRSKGAFTPGTSTKGEPENAGPFASTSFPSTDVFKCLLTPSSAPSASAHASKLPSLLPTSTSSSSTIRSSNGSTTTGTENTKENSTTSDTPTVDASGPTATATHTAPTATFSSSSFAHTTAGVVTNPATNTTTATSSSPFFSFKSWDAGARPSSTTVASSEDSKPFLFPSFSASNPPRLPTTAVGGTAIPSTAGGSAPPIFPPNAFSFGNAVTSFAEARKKAEEMQMARQTQEQGQAKDEKGSDVTSSETAKMEAAEEEPSSALFSPSSAFQAAPGEILASGPSKLFRFDKPNNKWVECGEGEAKLKREKKVLKPSTTTTEEKEGDTNLPTSSSDASVPSSSSSPTEGETEKETEDVVRLLVRDGYSLNVVVTKGAFILTSSPSSTTSGNSNDSSFDTKNRVTDKHLVFTVNTREEGVRHYLLKFTGAVAENNAKTFGERLKEVC